MQQEPAADVHALLAKCRRRVRHDGWAPWLASDQLCHATQHAAQQFACHGRIVAAWQLGAMTACKLGPAEPNGWQQSTRQCSHHMPAHQVMRSSTPISFLKRTLASAAGHAGGGYT